MSGGWSSRCRRTAGARAPLIRRRIARGFLPLPPKPTLPSSTAGVRAAVGADLASVVRQGLGWREEEEEPEVQG